MKISKKVIAPVLAVLAAVGIATAGASSAQAGGPPKPGHAPIICMLTGAGAGFPTLDTGCGWGSVGGGTQVGNYWGYDRSFFTDTKDKSPWAVIKDPSLFPSSDSGYDCVAGNNGSAICTRHSDSTPKPGVDNATVNQLASGTMAAAGSVLGFEEKDNMVCAGDHHNGCFAVDVTYSKYTARAVYEYDSPGDMPYITAVSWYKKDGKGFAGRGTYLGDSTHFLTTATSADDLTDAAGMIASDSLSTNSATTTGGDVTYELNVMAKKAGSAIVHVNGIGFTVTDNRQLPAGWIALPTSDPSEAAYLVPGLAVNQPQTAQIHFTVTGASNDIIVSDVNGTQVSQTLAVRPGAPACTTPDRAFHGSAVIPTGGASTVLDGEFCSVQADSTLKVWTGDQRGAGTLTIIGAGNNHSVSYQAPAADFSGSDTVYVYAENSAGVASAPTAVPVTVAAPATAVADSYRASSGSTLTVDADHGLLANEAFAAGRDGWTVQQGYAPANGELTTQADGSFSYTPHAGFSGDDTFRYQLKGPHGQTSNVVTVTIHVAPAAPTCTTADGASNGRAVVPTGGAVTKLDGVYCSVAAGSTLQVFTGDQHGAGQLAIVGDGDNHAVIYQAPSATYTGDDTVSVYAVDASGAASSPTAVPVTVAAPATAVADSYTTAPGQTLTVDTEHGLLANEEFNTGRDGWTVQQGNPPANGDLTMKLDGSFSYTPHSGFTGDDTFKYRLNGPHGQASNVVTVTIHVAG
ncbi:MAG: hypothetical protein JWQ19_3872 [Subtercola sp.]|nr:hypothetical protein [Subtercola sp.]